MNSEQIDEDAKWGFWRSSRIPDEGDVYMRRITILQTPWFSIKLHRLYRPDAQRELHDHPWRFISIPILGSYVEETPDGPRWIRWFNYKGLKDRHSISWVSRTPVWTIVITGRKQQEWGFWVDGFQGAATERFVPHYLYDKEA